MFKLVVKRCASLMSDGVTRDIMKLRYFDETKAKQRLKQGRPFLLPTVTLTL